MKVLETFFLIKPDAIFRHIDGDVIERIKSKGFVILNSIKYRLTPKDVIELYDAYTLANFPKKYRIMKSKLLVSYITSGEISVLFVLLNKLPLNCSSVFEYAREIQGFDYYPIKCQIGSIRYDFREVNANHKPIIIEKIPGFGDVAGEIIYNLLHTPSDSYEYEYQKKILLKIYSRAIIGEQSNAKKNLIKPSA